MLLNVSSLDNYFNIFSIIFLTPKCIYFLMINKNYRSLNMFGVHKKVLGKYRLEYSDPSNSSLANFPRKFWPGVLPPILSSHYKRHFFH